jgi:Na+/H+ antiporter NhaB
MRFVTAGRGTRASWVSILGVLCIVLVLMTSMMQVTHSHPAGHVDHDCALCFTAHQVVQIAVVVTVVLASRPVARAASEEFSPLPRQRFVLKLANRPPPVPAVFA